MQILNMFTLRKCLSAQFGVCNAVVSLLWVGVSSSKNQSFAGLCDRAPGLIMSHEVYMNVTH